MAIEREKILEKALELVNELGLDLFTTRRLADRLGVQQPALYWHFRSKSALLDALNEMMLMRFHRHRVPSPRESWDKFALAHARSFRKALLSVRNGARIVAGTHPTIRQFADAERQLELYVAAGFSPQQALSISLGIARYVVGFVLEEQDERERSNETHDTAADPMDEVTAFPILSRAIQPMVRAGSINTEDMFERGLGFMLEGMRRTLEKQIGEPEGRRKRKARSAARGRT